MSVIPVGNILKIAKLEKYAKTLETLVTKVVPNCPSLYRELVPLMTESRSLVAKIPSGSEAIEKMRTLISQFFKDAELYRMSTRVRALKDWAPFAKMRGAWKDIAFAKGGTTPAEVVDKLLNAAENHASPSVRMNAKEMLVELGQRNWVISAGPHVTTATAGGVLDQTSHITLEVAGHPYPYHLRLDNKGHIWEIRTMQKSGGVTKAVNPVPNSPRPWTGPGQ